MSSARRFKEKTATHWLAQAADRHDILKSLLSMEATPDIRKQEAEAYRVLVAAAESFLHTVPEHFRGNHALYKHIADLHHPCPACGRALNGRAAGVHAGEAVPGDEQADR